MKRTLVLASLLALAVSTAFAEPGPGYGPGMMGGYGPGMMGGYGPGMMGGYGYGPGMMSGYGPGMMGGYGPGYGGLGSLDLTPEQAQKIAAIQEDNRSKNWGVMGEMRSEMFKLRRLYAAESVDPNAITEQHKKVDELHRKVFLSRLEAQKHVEAVLTPEQRKRFQSFRPRWMEGLDELQ